MSNKGMFESILEILCFGAMFSYAQSMGKKEAEQEMENKRIREELENLKRRFNTMKS